MSFRRDIARLYARCGAHTFVPFIGQAYDAPSPSQLHVLVVGMNSHIFDEHVEATKQSLPVAQSDLDVLHASRKATRACVETAAVVTAGGDTFAVRAK